MEYYPRLTWAVLVENLLHRVAWSSERSPRENSAGDVLFVSTEKIISRGESSPVEPSSRAAFGSEPQGRGQAEESLRAMCRELVEAVGRAMLMHKAFCGTG